MDARDETGQEVDEATVRTSVAAAALGNCMEWFDFGVYSYLAATIGHVFFPTDHVTSLLSSFAVFGVAFMVRPLGGFVFGPLGDKVGRIRILAITIITMSAGTFAIGVIPGFDQIGIWAPVLLVLARLVQGFSAGGEYGGAATFVVEFAPDDRRGFLAAWLDFGTLAGYSFGALIVTGLTLGLSSHAMSSWGWRVPFLLAGPLGLFGLYLRLRLEDSPAYQRLAGTGQVSRSPLKETAVQNWRLILLCMGLVLILNVAYYDVLTYLPTYLSSQLHIGKSTALMAIVGVMVGMMGMAPMLGRLSDRVGRKPLLLAACLGFIVFGYPAFWMLQTGGIALLIVGLAVLGLLTVMLAGIMPSTLPAIFPTRTRYSSFAIAYNLSTSLFGGTAPFVIQWLVSVTHDDYVPAFYVMGAAVIAIIPIMLMRESAAQPLLGSVAQRARRV